MGEGRPQKRQADGPTAANGRTAKSFGVNHAATFGRPDLFIFLGLAVITFGIYAQVIRHQFITLDDGWYIKDNPMVNCGVTFAGLAWAFTTFSQANWHPLTWIAHMIDSQLFGLNAGGHLLVNVTNSCGKHIACLLVSVANDTCSMAKRASGRSFCASSVARGVCRLGG